MTPTMNAARADDVPAVLSFGFRPFFLGASVWAAASMVLWIAMLTGVAQLPTALEPASWHVHEFLFGYLGAVLAGISPDRRSKLDWTTAAGSVGRLRCWPCCGCWAGLQWRFRRICRLSWLLRRI